MTQIINNDHSDERLNLVEKITECKRVVDYASSIVDENAKCYAEYQLLEKKEKEILETGMVRSWLVGLLGGIGIFVLLFLVVYITYDITIKISAMISAIGIVVSVGIGYGSYMTIRESFFDKTFAPKNEEKQKQFVAEQMEPKGIECNNLVKQYENYINSEEYIAATSFIPEKYCYKEIIDFLYDVIINCRADSLKEAINLYENKCYNDEMTQNIENIKTRQNAMIILQNDQNEKLDETNAGIRKTRKAVKYGNVVSTVDTVRHWKKD